MFKEEIIRVLKTLVPEPVLEVPPDPKLGDYAFPCFSLSKELKKSPASIAKEIAGSIQRPSFVEKVEAAGPYVNFFLKTSYVARMIIDEIFDKKDKFGSTKQGKGHALVIDYSSPNVGKPFHIGHLRSTIIGQSLYKIHDFLGYKIIRWNYIGDWGTQYGKLISAFLNWGDEKRLKTHKVRYMHELYVRFNKESKDDPGLQDEAREWFKRLEDGDKTAVKLWKEFRDYSLEEFDRIYSILGVEFDTNKGESFFNDKMMPIVDLAKEKGLAIEDEGALVVPVEGQIPFMLLKSDGATTYGLRDLALMKYRIDHYKAEGTLYVVGVEQTLYFRQLFIVGKSLFSPDLYLQHVPFGMYLDKEGKKMASRKGETIFLTDVLKSTIEKAKMLIEEKNPDLKSKDEVARSVGVGAVFFGDLMNDRIKDCVFDWDRILDFEGDTGPYLQYTHARAASILRKAKAEGMKIKKNNKYDFSEECEAKLVRLLSSFPETVQEAFSNYKPHIIAQYCLELARCFNEFYHKCPCISEADERLRLARLALVEGSRQVIHNGLQLLSMDAPSEM